MRARPIAALALAAAAACSDRTPVAPEGAAAFLPCLFGSGSTLQTGEVLQLSGAAGEVLCLDGGGEYTLVPFYASGSGSARLRVSAEGGNVQPVSGPPTPSLGAARAAGDGRWRRDPEAHLRLRERFHREASARIRAAPGPAAGLSPAPAAAAAVPAPGDPLTVAIPQFYRNVDPCEVRAVRQARVGAVSQRAILVNDPANPPGGLTEADLHAFGEEFDRLIHPTGVRYFGEPTDLDGNGRVIIVFTREVNALTPAGAGGGFVGGFFYAGDLFPLQDTRLPGGVLLEACPRSNVGEIFYVLAPDPQGSVNGNRFSRDFVLASAAGTIAHELEHLINASRRIFVNGATRLEDVWLDEGLAHSAEELVFYEASGLGPRQNLDRARLTSTPAAAAATDRYLLDNLGRYLTYLEEPDSNSLIGADELPTRGAAWAFLRYAADREPGPDQAFFFSLVNTTATGVANVSRVIGADAIDWMQDWTLSVYADDAVPGVDPRHEQPSWDFRSVMPRVAEVFGRPAAFPLKVILLGDGGPREVNLRGGGSAFIRFGIAPGGRAALRLRTAASPAPDALRVSVVRTR